MKKPKYLIYIGLVTIMGVLQVLNTPVYAADAGYDWSSGYKFRTDPKAKAPDDGSMDSEGFFKNLPIKGGALINGGYVEMQSTFAVDQSNWNDTYPVCRSGDLQERCSVDGEVITGMVNFTYTCSGDVSYQLNTDVSSKSVVGGDTMYGAWALLQNFLPDYVKGDCGSAGRCFVGNAIILDTKAQKEDNMGRYMGLGLKMLVEGPGDVFYMDQIRGLTQPSTYGGYKLNEPYLVGYMVSGTTNLVGCDGKLFEQLLGSTYQHVIDNMYPGAEEVFKTSVLPQLEANPVLMEAYAAGEAASNGTVPCEILAGIHWNEGGNSPNIPIWDPAKGFQGGSLLTDGEYAGSSLGSRIKQYGWDNKSVLGWSNILSEYNGFGNLNCMDPGTEAYNCFGPTVPTRWRQGGKCDSYQKFDDSPYAMSWLDGRHADMDLIFMRDGGSGNIDPCYAFRDFSGTLGPFPRESPGALAIAYLVHKYYKP
jgi:hypothetical protein